MRQSLKKMSIFAIPTMAGLGMLIGSPARGATIFSADFEPDQGYNSGTLGTVSGGYYPDSGGYGVYAAKNTGGETAWNQLGYAGTPSSSGNYGGQDGFIVANPNTTATPASGVANTSAHVLAIVGDSSPSHQVSGPRINATAVGASFTVLNTTQDLTISQSAYFPSSNSDGREIFIGDAPVGGHLPTLYFGESGYFASDTTGDLQFALTGKGGVLVNSPTLTADAWHTATYTIHFNASDLADSTMDFIVDGTTVEDGIAFDASQIGSESYWVNTDDYPDTSEPGAIYLDNISITQTVPEPASLSLLGFGAVLLARRRRRSRTSDVQRGT